MKDKVKCIASCICQRRGEDGIIRTYEAGAIAYWDELPENNWILAEDIGQGDIDFLRVPETMLRDDNLIPLQRITEFMSARFGFNYAGYPRHEVVEALLQLRTAPPEPFAQTPSTAPTAANYKGSANDSAIGVSVAVKPEVDDVESEDMAGSAIDEVVGSADEDEDDGMGGLDDLL